MARPLAGMRKVNIFPIVLREKPYYTSTKDKIMEDFLIKKRIVFHRLPLTLAAIFLSAPFLFAQQNTSPNNSITFTTYYPAPFGAYDRVC